jgi:CRP/FNR family transcriptional regulator, cyclic AMP receptor protein
LSFAELLSQVIASFTQSLDQPKELLAVAAALLAAGLVITSSFVKTIIPLRWLAVGSNAGFIVYGLLHPSPLVLLLHATLLPVNLYRTAEMIRLTKRVNGVAAEGEQPDVWLKPYMRRRKMKAGDVLFRQGDLADHLYYLVDGRIEFVEFGSSMQPGRLFGEIAFFAPDRKRTATARCATPCTLLSIDESTFKQLYFQNPAFGFEIVRLIAGRLTEDVQRVRRQLAETAARAEPAVAPPAAATPPPVG